MFYNTDVIVSLQTIKANLESRVCVNRTVCDIVIKEERFMNVKFSKGS